MAQVDNKSNKCNTSNKMISIIYEPSYIFYIKAILNKYSVEKESLNT
jgi:hypothetical protein